MTERVLVTGATGFIGSSICRALISHGHEVRALHRQTSSLRALQGIPVEFHVGDILEPDTLQQPLCDVDLVFHAAAQSAYWRHPELVRQTAAAGTGNVLRAAANAGVKRVVLTSSVAAMGVPRHDEYLTEEHTYNLPPKRFPYGYAKRESELEALKYVDRGIEVVIVNPSVVIGPGDLNQISGAMVTEAARGWGFFWMDGGINVVHIDDVVAGHLAAARRGRSGERYILGGENLSHHQVFSTLTEIAGRRAPWLKIPTRGIGPAAWLCDVLGKWLPLPFNGAQLRMTCEYLYCDTSKSKRELNLSDPKPFRQAAQEAYDWYREHGYL
ncbi:MAG: NAD-dependent epimerase/dehydratase family protein [Anaerolineales bacterium]